MITFKNDREAKRKQAICKTCIFRSGLVCGECGCPVKAITLARDNSLCNKGKW